MTSTPEWIAVDWGTSRLRAYPMTGETAGAEISSDRGMGTLGPSEFEGALLDLISPWLSERTTVIAGGMVGARQGWVEAAYRPVPTAPMGGPLTRAPVNRPGLDVWVVPGLSQAAPPDVMRGEEVQIAGFLALNPRFDGIICLPGTHTKWVQVSAGEVVSFQTFMTGEMFAVLAKHSVLRHTVGGSDWDDEAFETALADGLSSPAHVARHLFGLRASALLEGLGAGAARARLSGLLLGIELAAARPYWLGQDIALIGTANLSGHYAQALALQGVTATLAKADAMTVRGLVAARALTKETAL